MTTAEAAVLPGTGRTTDHKPKNFGTSVLPASYSQTTPAACGFRDYGLSTSRFGGTPVRPFAERPCGRDARDPCPNHKLAGLP
jgi:hypothetical protein